MKKSIDPKFYFIYFSKNNYLISLFFGFMKTKDSHNFSKKNIRLGIVLLFTKFIAIV